MRLVRLWWTPDLTCSIAPVLHGGDVLLRLVVFWACFLPLGRCYSLDRLLKRKAQQAQKSSVYVSVGTLGLLTQLSLMYISAHFHKTGAEWRIDRTAAFYALSLDYFRTGLGDHVLAMGVRWPWLLKGLTFGVLEWQLVGPLLWFSPFYTQYTRLFSVAGFLMMHGARTRFISGCLTCLSKGSFGSCMALGTFTWITLTSQLALLPPLFWAVVFRLLRSPARTQLRIYFPANARSSFIARCLRLILLPEVGIQVRWYF